MIEKLLELGDGRLLVPIIVVFVGVALAKGGFTLTRSRSQDRRDFLDLFRGYRDENDLWLTVAVRHGFGAYLPANLIRQLMAGPQPGRALLDVCNAWNFLDMDDETGDLAWRRRLFRNARVRRIVVRVLSVLYFLLASLCLFLAYLCVKGTLDGKMLWIAWSYVILSGGGAFACLAYGDNLNDADKAARRWLGVL